MGQRVVVVVTGGGGQLHTHIGGERNLHSFEQNLRAVLLGHLHRGFALGEYLIKFLTAEQLEGEGYVALVIG